jgi:hypothetical protein
VRSQLIGKLHNSARNGSKGKITGTKDAHGQCFVEPAELHRVYPAVADAAGNAAATPISQWMMQRHLQWRNNVQRWQRRSWAS